jgi:hypothetical protein
VGECRNCGRLLTIDLGSIGEVAPFFLKRVLNLEYGLAPSEHPVTASCGGSDSWLRALRKSMESRCSSRLRAARSAHLSKQNYHFRRRQLEGSTLITALPHTTRREFDMNPSTPR